MTLEFNPPLSHIHSLLYYFHSYTGYKIKAQDGCWKLYTYCALVNLDAVVATKKCNSFYTLLLMTYFLKSLSPEDVRIFSLSPLFCNFMMICLVISLFKTYCAYTVSGLFFSFWKFKLPRPGNKPQIYSKSIDNNLTSILSAFFSPEIQVIFVHWSKNYITQPSISL